MDISTGYLLRDALKTEKRANGAAVNLLRDALALLNDRPRFHTRAGDLDSYKVAAEISAFLRERQIDDLARKAGEDWYSKPICPSS